MCSEAPHLYRDGDLCVRTLAIDQRIKRIVLRRQEYEGGERPFAVRFDSQVDVGFRFLETKNRTYQPGRISAECLVGTSVNSAARHDAINTKTISMAGWTHIQPSNTRSRVSKRQGGTGIVTETVRPAVRVD